MRIKDRIFYIANHFPVPFDPAPNSDYHDASMIKSIDRISDE
jgi:hypothetical protein